LITLATGLLVIGVFGSMLGAFGLAAIGAERDPTANLPPAVMYIAIPVAVSIISLFGAFEVLAKIYVPEAASLFVITTGAGGVFGVALTASVLPDAVNFTPTTMGVEEFDQWRCTQWLQDRTEAYSASNKIGAVALVPPLICTVVRVTGAVIRLNQWWSNAFVVVGILVAMAGGLAALNRTKHPASGNQQSGLKESEAWLTTLTISLFSAVLLIVLP